MRKAQSVLCMRQGNIFCAEKLEIFTHLKFYKENDFGPFQTVVLHHSHARWKLLIIMTY